MILVVYQYETHLNALPVFLVFFALGLNLPNLLLKYLLYQIY
jgi:hypothetical protein